MKRTLVAFGMLLALAHPASANEVSAYVRPPTCEKPWFKVGMINEVPRPNVFTLVKPSGATDYYLSHFETVRFTLDGGPLAGGKTVGVWGPYRSFYVEATAPDLRGC